MDPTSLFSKRKNDLYGTLLNIKKSGKCVYLRASFRQQNTGITISTDCNDTSNRTHCIIYITILKHSVLIRLRVIETLYIPISPTFHTLRGDFLMGNT